MDDLAALNLGATMLGSGGTGELTHAHLAARRALEEFGPVPVCTAADLAPDAWVLPMYFLGAPVVAIEMLPGGTELGTAVDMFERVRGIEVSALMVGEVAGLNVLLPIAEAARRGLPLIDADTMRRAFTRTQMTLMTLAGVRASPITIADAHGNCLYIETADNQTTEMIGRSVTTAMGHIAGVATYLLTAQEVIDHGVLGSLSYCLDLGRYLQRLGQGDSSLDDLLAHTDGGRLFTGAVIDATSTSVDRQPETVITLRGHDDDQRVMRIEAQNENLVAIEDGEILAVTPDLICLLDSQNGRPISTESVQAGMHLDAIALPCAEAWRSEAGIRLAGPRAHGYGIDYVEFAR